MPGVLPIDSLLPDIAASLERTRNLVIEAPPGAGKTTRVPPALLPRTSGEILVLEPRRIAARMAARRVADEMGEAVGKTVGYQIRFEEVAGPRTRLRFLTEGVLNRRLLSEPELRNVSTVILDEFHERHLDGDLALALIRRLQQTKRPDLRIVVMSATLNAAPIAAYLNTCPVIRSEGRLFDVDITYRGHSAAPLEEQVNAALNSLSNEEGDVLVFLPGAAEIRRTMRACARTDLLVLPLHGDLSPEEQDRAVRPADRRKLILSTNVAESSITIDGVTAVIDCGVARVARDSQWTGLPTLEIQRISKASATQRAGRAGRTQPGRALRLYSAEDFARRPAEDKPEIHRRELSQVVLELEALGIHEVPWFEPPPAEALAQAHELLERLGVREHGREMARYPLHPRLSRMLIEAKHRGSFDDACTVAAILSSGDRFDDSDVLHVLDRELPPRTAQIRRQIRASSAGHRPANSGTDEPLLISVLTAFSDRVARRRNEREVQLSSGISATFASPTIADFLVALDIENRTDQPLPLIRFAAAIKPDWLLDLFPERIRERSGVTWNRTAERVEAISTLLYDELVIEESHSSTADPNEASRLLAERAREAGLHRFVDPDELEAFLSRVAFAAQHGPIPLLTEADVHDALADLASGRRSFADLKAAASEGGLIRVLRSRLGRNERLLDEVAPERIRVGKRQVLVHYPRGQQPWIESRLQDFFGTRESPRVARGAVPVVVHLLAPNQRPVQQTSDLHGFWERLYPQVRRELMRRYPKHAWPENPMNPAPTASR